MTSAIVRRTGKLFESGRYEDKDYAMTDAELVAAAAAFSPVPIDIEHVPSVLSGKLGMLESVKIDADGKTLLGTVAMPSWLDALIDDSERKVSCTWNRATKTLAGLALVRTPRIADAVLMSAFSAAAPEAETVNIPADFAGQRHSASDAADIQMVHDVSVRQGAECAGKADMSTTAPLSPWEKFKRMMEGGEAAPAEFTAPVIPSVTPPDPEKDALKQQLAELQAAQAAQVATFRAETISRDAAAFADGEVAAGRAYPAEREAIIALFSAAAEDDATHGQASFSNGAKGSRVDALKAAYAQRPPHGLTRELLAQTVNAGGATALPNQATTEFSGAEKPITPERRAQLLRLTAIGREVLASEKK